MPSYKMHIGQIRNAPDMKTLGEKLAAWGKPADQPAGVLDVVAGDKYITANLVYSKQVKLPKVTVQKGATAAETADIEVKVATKDIVIPFAIKDASELRVVEAYAGGPSVFDSLQTLLKGVCESNDLAIEPIGLDPMETFDKLKRAVPAALLLSAVLPGYMPDHRARGQFTAKFTDTAQGIEFIEGIKGEQAIKSVKAQLRGPSARVTFTLGQTASISFTAKDDDESWGKRIARGLAGVIPADQMLG